MKVIIISGPTATGKTDLSIELAKKFGGEIVNFDSLLLYKEIEIGTAKPTMEERILIPHHMIDVASISSPLNASDYIKMARPIVDDLLSKNRLVFLVGGSGFYLQALIKGMYDSPSTPSDVLERSEKLYQSEGIAPFLKILKQNDLKSFERYHENDHYRIRRAVEHFWANGTPLSLAREMKDEENAKLVNSSIHSWDILHLHLDLPKEEHLKIIEARTDKMLRNGLLDEVEQLLSLGFTGQEKPLQSIGYKEVLELNRGVLNNLNECRERIIISTRQLAKSQRTWFNRTPNKLKFSPHQKNEIFEIVNIFLNK
jgi:tRNA dimethylallyltransferase